MGKRVRIATFNCENLFSRAKVLNLRSKVATGDLLDEIAQLERILAKKTYTPDDQKGILTLTGKLSPYIDIAEDRGKLFTGRGAGRRVSAGGAGDWDGSIVFRRSSFNDQQRENTAKVVKDLAADIQCLIEIEDRPTIDSFNSQMLGSAFSFNMLIDGFDPRGIDIGLLAKFPIRNIRTHIFDKDADGRVFSRDCLEIEVEVKKGQSLFMLVNHFKSQGYGNQADNDAKRKRQAKAVARILQDYDLKKQLVVVAGDFNDSPDRPPKSLSPLLGVSGLSDVLALQFPKPEDRWTYYYKKTEQIDYILVSDALKKCFKNAGIERRGIANLEKITKGAEKSFPSVTSQATAASDHGAIWADFEV